jgi:hypothetical protein
VHALTTRSYLHNCESSPLLGLPAELPNTILEYVFHDNTVETFDTSGIRDFSTRACFSLLRTCRQLNTEVRNLRVNMSNVVYNDSGLTGLFTVDDWSISLRGADPFIWDRRIEAFYDNGITGDDDGTNNGSR